MIEILEIGIDIKKELDKIYQRRRIRLTPWYKKAVCLLIGHKPNHIIYCGDTKIESGCSRCHKPIFGNYLDEWFIDKRRLSEIMD